MPLNSIIASNLDAIEELGVVLQSLDDKQFGLTVCDIAVSTLGCHVRHVIEHYDSFFAGLDSAVIDYDARARDKRVETQLNVAQHRLLELGVKLRQLASDKAEGEQPLDIQLQTQWDEAPGPVTRSSLARELVFLHGHTTHHFAQMALHMRAMGLAVAPEFGMAPSTLRFHQDAQKRPPQSLSA